MQNINIENTDFSPSIQTDFENGTINIKGKSYPENTLEFYEPFMDALEEFLSSLPTNKLIFNLEIIYFNSSSSKKFFEIFDLLDENREKLDIEVNWIYDKEDESSKEVGEEFQEDFEELNIKLIVKQ